MPEQMDKFSGIDALTIIEKYSNDDSLVLHRAELLRFTAENFESAGVKLFSLGSNKPSTSAETVPSAGEEAIAVSILVRIGAQIVSASADLFADGRHYAAAALLRQLVEIEYLAWAIDTREQDGMRWLRSDREVRRSTFSPGRLRKAANGKFRSKDYSFHCEFGGHPTPNGGLMLLNDNSSSVQVLVTDLLGHAGRIWDHLVNWARNNPCGVPIIERSKQMSSRFSSWKAQDPLSWLPPPPLP